MESGEGALGRQPGTYVSLPDEDLVRLAARDREAFVCLYLRYVQRVYSYVAWRIGRREAEDITADVFMRALEGMGRFQPERSFRAWLFGIAHHRVSEYLRKRKPGALLDDHLAGTQGDPEEISLAAERVAMARSLVAELPTQHREVIELRYWAGLPIREVAHLTGRSEGAVKVLIHRILRGMKDKLEERR
ncbi:MAG: sigma-70 family RNA polymerase sigma factor [Chloroflexota bacterium]|nr:sigma-70 family RNA polymerase sigma factor [Chloroflexota bacterium]